MGYRSERQRQRASEANGAKFLDAKKSHQRRGQRFTLLSFLVLLGCLAVMKAINPDLPLKSPLIMICSVALACAIMAMIGSRGEKS